MESILPTTSLNNTSWPTAELSAKANGIVWCSAFAFEAVLIITGNLSTIVLFLTNKRLRKKSLFFVINMAFADLMLGAISVPFYIYFTGIDYGLWKTIMPTFLLIFFLLAQNAFLYASVISAAFISGERFYAIYWPLKQRTLSMRAYRILIFLVWMLALLASAIFTFGIQIFTSKISAYVLLAFFFIFITMFCGCNIAIWRKCQHRKIGDVQQQNRDLQIQHLTKTLLIVSVVALLAWLPLVTMNCLLIVFEVSLPWGIYLASLVLNFSNSFVNPIVYVLRIPEFKEAMVSLCCFRRLVAKDREGNRRLDDRAVALTPVALRTDQSLSRLQLACAEEVMITRL